MPGPGFVGCKITKNNIGGAVQKMREEVSHVIEEGCYLMGQEASDLAPKRSGELAADWRVVQRGLLTFYLIFGENLPDARAVYQEFGTAHHPAQPYLEPTVTNNESVISQMIAEAVHGKVVNSDVRVQHLSNVED